MLFEVYRSYRAMGRVALGHISSLSRIEDSLDCALRDTQQIPTKWIAGDLRKKRQIISPARWGRRRRSIARLMRVLPATKTLRRQVTAKPWRTFSISSPKASQTEELLAVSSLQRARGSLLMIMHLRKERLLGNMADSRSAASLARTIPSTTRLDWGRGSLKERGKLKC